MGQYCSSERWKQLETIGVLEPDNIKNSWISAAVPQCSPSLTLTLQTLSPLLVLCPCRRRIAALMAVLLFSLAHCCRAVI